jgi:hypothetical protein
MYTAMPTVDRTISTMNARVEWLTTVTLPHEEVEVKV